jgi:hypothetical protein
MIRDALGKLDYWNGKVDFSFYAIADKLEDLKVPAKNPSYEPRFLFGLAKEYLQLMLSRYSRGDDIKELAQYFPPMLEAWEKSEALDKLMSTPEQQYTRRTWSVNFDHYIVCFWLVGLALALEIPDAQWQRLLVLVRNEGDDVLLDRIIATRQPGRKVGTQLCYPKPYRRLLDALDAPAKRQPKLLADFVRHWYKELDRPATKEMAAIYRRPYWYSLGNRQLEDSGYFGRWCVEAVAAVKVFGLDDSLCLGHEHYPGDLLRPDGPSTHPERPETSIPETKPEPEPEPEPKRGWRSWLKRWNLPT